MKNITFRLRLFYQIGLTAGLFIFLTIGNAHSFQSSNTLNEQKNEIIYEGIELLYSGSWSEAIDQFNKISAIDPNCAESEFFESFVYEFVMDQYRCEIFDEAFNVAVEKAIARAEEVVKTHPTARNYMFLGGCYGVKGVRKGILGAWFQAYRNGRKARGYMEDAIKKDPTIYDCYYGIGSYNYWASRKLKRFLGPFVKDKRMQGIDELKLTIAEGIFSPKAGKNALFRIYIEEEWYDKVLELAEEVLEDLPGILFPRWYYGLAFIRTNEWQKALDNYSRMSEILDTVDCKGGEALVEVWYYSALCNYNLGEFQKAKDLLVKILPYEGKVNLNMFFYGNLIKKSKNLIKKVDKAIGK